MEAAAANLDYLDGAEVGPLNWLGNSPRVTASSSWEIPVVNLKKKKVSQKERRRAQKEFTASAESSAMLGKATTGWNVPTSSGPADAAAPSVPGSSRSPATAVAAAVGVTPKRAVTSFMSVLAEDERLAKDRDRRAVLAAAAAGPARPVDEASGQWELELGLTPPRATNGSTPRFDRFDHHPAAVATPYKSNFASILHEQEQVTLVGRAVVTRDRHKSLTAIQLEEKALREIASLYGTDEELVTVQLQSRAMDM